MTSMNKNQSGSTIPEECQVSYMKNIYTELVEGIQSVDARTERIDNQLFIIQKACEMLNLQICKTEERLNKLAEKGRESHKEWEKEIELRLDRMSVSHLYSTKLVDRLIEMSLVVKGDSREAALHRAQATRDDTFGKMYPEPPADEWPPPGCDAMDVRG